MMRWLKEKKKEKRSNSTSRDDGGKEDDYGFGKEKAVTKSPSSRRELPPTPANPEERSPHIYEEIPDLPLCCMPDNERALLQSKFGKNKNAFTLAAGAVPESSSVASKSGYSEKDEISPYMIVPVDNEVRQTPTDFHRNGTPEVHCDVIVKDTHCEILLTRKPKVGVFRLDNPGLSVTGENGDKRNIRNNTHFCSRDRRAYSCVHSAGNLSSAFSVASSGFSSSSASKIQSGGASSSLTLGNLTEPLETSEKSDGDKTSEQGVITYSTASNFIPRATKLVFNPLPGKNPCKEAFGSDSSDELHGAGYSSIKDDDFGAASASFASSRDHQSGSKCVTYATVESHEPNIESQVTYASVQDQHFTNSMTKPNYSFDEHHHSQFNLKPPKSQHNSSKENNNFGGASRTGIIRPLSPSNSSNCIYALVTFPTEPKHYNTIADINPTDFAENGPCHEEDFNNDSLGVVYSSINGQFGIDIGCPPCNGEIGDNRNPSEAVFPGKTSFHLSDTQRKFSKESSCFNFSEQIHSGFSVDRIRFDSNSRNYRGIADKTEMKNDQDTTSDVQQGNCVKRSPEFHTSSGHCENSVQLEFCFCSDEHSSSCGCPEAKHNQDDDLASVAGAASDGPNSCTSCGRLIRQITYSESYSDETYDHVYASRLLIRTGRRFSSPDITFSEASNSEFHDIQATHSPDFPYAVSRDDSWMSTRNSDILPPSYSASAESTKVLNKLCHVPQFTEQNFVDELGCNYNNNNREPREHLHRQLGGSKHVEQNNSSVSKLSSTLHTLNCIASRNLTMASVKMAKCPLNNESRVLTNETNYVLGIPRKSLATSNADQSRSLVEPAVDKFVVDKSRILDSSLTTETKISGFTGILSKFSRAKSVKSAVAEPAEMTNACAVLGEKPRHGEQFKCDKDLEEIPERNTKKLSTFFQRLASKEPSKDTSDPVTPQDTVEMASALVVNDLKLSGKPPKLFTLENNTTNSQKYCRDEKQSTTLHTVKVTDEAQHCKTSTDISEKRVTSQTHIYPAYPQSCSSGHPITSAALSDQPLPETAIILDNDVASASEGLLSTTKPQFKTDSGDTCYEYDISTSSEGEQTGYEYFLSKVKKTLNLEHEVQHIAESSFVRRKRLCKRCKNEGMYSTIDDDEDDISDRDGLCPHLAAKIGDMRAIFEDLVVDQRAVILDCLSDYTLSPYGSRGHGHDGYCRECGCEILTSDSESLTTVCSLLSQQFRMTSPNGQTLSCDSDEGTMADNSCESADENGENNSNNNKNHYDGNSSGYDEPKGKSENGGQKPRKKERKDKKLSSSTLAHFATKEAEKLSPTSTTIQDDSPAGASVLQSLKDGKRTTVPSVSSESHRKSILKKNASALLSAHPSRHAAGLYSSLGSESKDDHSDHSRICDANRSRASSITDKVLQDIYAPLPSKALSLLTSRNYGSPLGLTCTCGRGLQASLTTMAAHLATGKTIPPPTGCTKKDNSLKPSSTSLPQDGDKKVGVVPVQKHSEKGGKNGSEIEQFILSERKDNPKNNQRTMDCPPEKEVLVNNGCSPAQKNAESNECLDSQTKPGNRTFRKERSNVPAKEGSPLRNRSLPTKQPYNPTTKSDCGAFASSHQEKDKCAHISLPHTTKDSAVSALNAEITAVDSSEYPYSENPYNDVYERSFVELTTDNSKTECTRKHRLKIVALDLLPESVVDGDTTETTQSPKKLAIQPKRSKVIEKMAKIFESNSDSTNNNQKFTKIKEVMILDLTTEKNSGHKTNLPKKYICQVESQSQVSQQHSENSLASEVSERVLNIPNSSSKRSFPDAISFNLTRQDNLCCRPENHNLNLNANPPASDLLRTSKTLRSRSGSKQGKVNETRAKSDNESDRLKPEFKSVKVKPGKAKSPYLTESRLVKQRSPTSSSSSVSSSSSSKRKSGHAKHKLSKKSYRKRSKHRSERSKHGHGKEERTYYYFSSDFSDIDVVELENCEPYATSASTDNSVSNKLALSKKKRCISSDDLLMISSENVNNVPAPSPNSNIEGAAGGFCEQEVYAIPVSSADLRSRKNSNETGVSPQPSPEMTKYRKMKRTDVYKSRKSNNKLLSDLIIRNYDMQVYGNI